MARGSVKVIFKYLKKVPEEHRDIRTGAGGSPEPARSPWLPPWLLGKNGVRATGLGTLRGGWSPAELDGGACLQSAQKYSRVFVTVTTMLAFSS